MGKIITSGGIRYSGTSNALNGGAGLATLLHSYTGSGVLRCVQVAGGVVSVEIDGVHVTTMGGNANGADNGVINLRFTTGFKIYGGASTVPVILIYQTGANKYSQIGVANGTASAGTKALALSVTGRGHISFALLEPAGGKIVVDGVTLVDNQTSSSQSAKDIWFNTSFQYYATTGKVLYSLE